MAVKSVVRKVPRISEEEYREKLGLKRLSMDGAEKPDNVPMAPPIGYKKQPSIFENMREMVKAELARQAKNEGFETEEEANQLDVPEERDPFSKHEFTEMEEEFVNKTISDSKAARKRMAASEPKAPAGQGPAEPAREALDAPKEPEAKKS